MAHNVSSSDCNWWIKGRGVNIHGSPWAKGAEAGWSFSVGGYRVMAAKRSECQQWKGSSKVEACSDDDITTTMGHIWWEMEAKDGVSFLCNNAQLSHLLSYTHLDCGSESVLSFNNSSEISVSRISGLDLFPYLRHTARQAGKRMNDYQAAEEFKAPQLGPFAYHVISHRKRQDCSWIEHREISLTLLRSRSPCHVSNSELCQVGTQSDPDSVGADRSCIAGGHFSFSVCQMISHVRALSPLGGETPVEVSKPLTKKKAENCGWFGTTCWPCQSFLLRFVCLFSPFCLFDVSHSAL